MNPKLQLKNHTLNSIRWVSFGNFVPKLFTPLISIWLANILSPSDFGILSLSLVFIGFANILQGFGLGDFILKEKEINDVQLSTAFWINLCLGVIFYLILVLFSNFIAILYKTPILTNVIPLISLIIIFNSLGRIQLSLLIKEMKFKKLFYVQLIPMLVSLFVVIPIAYINRSFWALIIGEIVKSFFINFLYWIKGNWKPKLIFDFRLLKEMSRFSIWVTFERIEEYFYSNIDRIILGYFGSLSILGVYSLARQIFTSVFMVTVSPIQNIAFPMLSKLQNNIDDLKSGFLQIIKKLFTINFPIMIGIALISTPLIPLIFGTKWMELPLVLSILVLGEGMVVILGAQRELFKIFNRPQIYPLSLIVNVLFALIAYTLSAKYGIIIFCFVRVMNDWLFVLVQTSLVRKIIKIKYLDIISLIKDPLISSLVMGSVLIMVLLTFKFINYVPDIISVVFLILISIFVYIMSYRLLNKNDFFKLFVEIKTILGLAK